MPIRGRKHWPARRAWAWSCSSLVAASGRAHLISPMSNINTLDQLQPDSDNPASTGTADLAAFDAYSRAVMGAVDKVGPAVLHLQIEAQKGPGGSGSGVV